MFQNKKFSNLADRWGRDIEIVRHGCPFLDSFLPERSEMSSELGSETVYYMFMVFTVLCTCNQYL